MVGQALVGSVYVFQTLFLDSDMQPLVVADPTITIFTYSTLGVKQELVSGAAMAAVAGDPGRYNYPYTVSSSFTSGDMIYATMEATNPVVLGARLVDEAELHVVGWGSQNSGGLYARFVRSG